MNCNGAAYLAGYSKIVSIPNRDFGELQCGCGVVDVGWFEVSIPNRDFGELQFSVEIQPLESHRFQSLIGILVNCNLIASLLTLPAVLFQSLIGILVNCNLGGVPLRSSFDLVSIPNRDFGELQSKPKLLATFRSIVSIPNRDFGELQ